MTTEDQGPEGTTEFTAPPASEQAAAAEAAELPQDAPEAPDGPVVDQEARAALEGLVARMTAMEAAVQAQGAVLDGLASVVGAGADDPGPSLEVSVTRGDSAEAKCPRCSKPVGPEDETCPTCGRRLVELEQLEPAE